MIKITADINETCLDEYRDGHLDAFTRHLVKDLDWTTEFSTLVIRDAVRFLYMCALPLMTYDETVSHEARVMISSPIVDEVIDRIFLDSQLLAWLEKNVFGAKMLHVPAYSHGITDPAINAARYEFSVSLMQAAGYELDREVIWPARLPVGYQTCTNGNDVLDCEVMAVRYHKFENA